MPVLPQSQSNLHLDILMGRDETLECADFMMPGTSCSRPFYNDYLLTEHINYAVSEMRQPLDIHADMEKKLRM